MSCQIPYWKILYLRPDLEKGEFVISYYEYFDGSEAARVSMETGEIIYSDNIYKDEIKEDEDFLKFIDSLDYTAAYIDSDWKRKEHNLSFSFFCGLNNTERISETWSFYIKSGYKKFTEHKYKIEYFSESVIVTIPLAFRETTTDATFELKKSELSTQDIFNAIMEDIKDRLGKHFAYYINI